MTRQTSNNPIKDATNKQNTEALRKRRKKLYFFAITIILILFNIQLLRSVTISIAKFIDLNSKVSKLKNINKTTREKNTRLKDELQTYKTAKGAEQVARDNMNLAGKNEILVIIKDKTRESTNKDKKNPPKGR